MYNLTQNGGYTHYRSISYSFVFEDSIVDSNTQLQGVVCLDSVVRGLSVAVEVWHRDTLLLTGTTSDHPVHT